MTCRPIIFTATVLALAACDADDRDVEAGTAEPTATASETAGLATTPAGPPRPERLDSVDDLREAVESAGYTCDDWRVVAETDAAIERASCSSNVILSIHTDATQAQRSVEFTASIAAIGDLRSVHLTGANWSINCGSNRPMCTKFADSLGGEVQVFND